MKMREVELNTIFNLIPDPEKNFVNINDNKIKNDVERITRIFNMVKEQNEIFQGEAVVNYAQFDLLACEN
jgi:hypothetical protein